MGEGRRPREDAELDELRRLGPPRDEGLARRVGLGGVLAAVLGDVERPRIGGFVVERRVGQGGMGVVYRGRDPRTGEAVAIKVIERGDAKERARFEAEARALRSLDHPNVVRYLDHGVSDEGAPFLVMQWLEGMDLARRLERRLLGVEEALTLARAVAEGLAAAHEAGIVHRDVKPSNVFLVGEDLRGARVIDFGIARTEQRGDRLTSTGVLVGTPGYMAPEQIRGEHDARTDVYGLGALLFECLTGRPPFVGSHPGAVLLAVVAEAVPPLTSLRDGIPHAVDALVGRMLAKDLADRPRDMRAVITELAVLATREPRRALSRAERRPPRSPGQEAAAFAPDGGVVGRDRELAIVHGVLRESAEEGTPAIVVVTGDAGVGKSALVDAVAREAAHRDGTRLLRAAGRRARAGVPFGVLAELVKSDPLPGEEAGRLLDLLSEIDAPRADRDPRALADRTRLAWLELLEAWCAEGPVAVVLDDAHLTDNATLHYLADGLARVSERSAHDPDAPLTLVLAQRSTTVTASLLASVGARRNVAVEIGPLAWRSTLRLASAWARGADAAHIADLARLSGGHPAHLRALCLTAAHEEGRIGGSVAALVWARIEGLDPESRRILRAAGIAGPRFVPETVLAVLGDASPELVTRRLRSLADAGLLRACAGGELELASDLVHLALRELCTDEDLRAGHREVARWLASRGRSPAEIAHHLAEAGADEEAAGQFLFAAEAALASDDPALVDEYLDRASRHATREETVGTSDAIRAQNALWRGRLPAGLAAARSALAALPVGSARWLGTASLAVTIAGLLGENAETERIAEQVGALAPEDDPLRDARVVAICRALTQLELTGAGTRSALWRHVERLDPQALACEPRAWLHRALATQVVAFAAIRHLFEAHRAHVEAGDLRAAAQVGVYLSSYLTWSGAFERSREVIDESLRLADRLDAGLLRTWAAYTEGKLLVEAGSSLDARAALEAVADHAGTSPRIRAGALVYAALAAHRAGAYDEAQQLAERARSAHVVPATVVPAVAARVRALLALGKVDDAAALEPALAGPEARAARLAEHEELVLLARVELLHALRRDGALREALRELRERIEARAATLEDPMRRNEYSARPHVVVAALSLARELEG